MPKFTSIRRPLSLDLLHTIYGIFTPVVRWLLYTNGGRLHLPAEIVEDEGTTMNYDNIAGKMIISVSKVQKGQYFHGLGNLSRFSPSFEQRDRGGLPKIELLDGDSDEDHGDGNVLFGQ